MLISFARISVWGSIQTLFSTLYLCNNQLSIYLSAGSAAFCQKVHILQQMLIPVVALHNLTKILSANPVALLKNYLATHIDN